MLMLERTSTSNYKYRAVKKSQFTDTTWRYMEAYPHDVFSFGFDVEIVYLGRDINEEIEFHKREILILEKLKLSRFTN